MAAPTGENYDTSGKWLGAGSFPPETTQYFTFHYKGEAGIDDTGFVVAPLLIEHLEANHPELTVLDLEGRTLKDADATPVILALKRNTTVTELKLGRNLMDHALLELAEILKTNTTITKVDVRQNDIKEKTAIGFAEVLGCNSTLLELNLSSNFVTGAAKHLALNLGMNTTLKKLCLEDCWIEDTDAGLLIAALDKNTAVAEFRGANNRCLQKDLRKKMRSWTR